LDFELRASRFAAIPPRFPNNGLGRARDGFFRQSAIDL
jgi:hypothetical protein